MGELAANILVVDDDPKVRELLKNCLEPEGFSVFEAETGTEVNTCLNQENIDLVTLDLSLGAEDGLTIAAQLRADFDIPIIIITGKGDVIDKVVGLEMGADDYISKPFHVREFIARVRSVLRRSKMQTEKQSHAPSSPCSRRKFEFDGWIVDLTSLELENPDGQPCELTTADFNLLGVFLQNPGIVLSRDQIMDHIQGHEWTPYDRTIDNQVARLRKKLRSEKGEKQYIKTVRGIGYSFTPDVNPI